MAKPTTASWSKLIILLGDGGSPEQFAAPCGLTSKGFNRSAETTDTSVVDCDDPDAPAWIERTTQSLSGEVTGSGVLALESLDEWDDWFQSGEPKNCRVNLDVPVASNGRYWEGSFILSTFNITGNLDDGKIQVEVTMTSAGEIVTQNIDI